ncbi:MAG: COQ9 family protein [Rhodospirillaceae bacterium]|nr:MAG: COQ9 family protein [Rhodospirillaceae bacterium]
MSAKQNAKQNPKPSREEKKDAIVLAASAHVAFDGWGYEALNAGAVDVGYDANTARRLFPGGAVDAIAHFATISDRAMMDAMNAADLDSMRVRDRVIFGVRARLEFLTPHKEAVRRGLGLLMLPTHTVLMAKITHTTVDNIWYLAGDRSADFNYYTKRTLLGGVYAATILFWLDDSSEDHQDTWDFLTRRIDDVLKIYPLKDKIEKAVEGFLKGSLLKSKFGV